MVPVFTVNRSTGEAPSYALRPRHGYSADLHGDLPNRRHQPAREFPAIAARRVAAQPTSARLELVFPLLRGVQPLVPRVHLPVSLAGPDLSGSTRPSRRCRGCFPPSPASPGSGCPQLLPSHCDGSAAVVSHPRSVEQRLTALDVDGTQFADGSIDVDRDGGATDDDLARFSSW